jgi:hypothetical protein
LESLSVAFLGLAQGVFQVLPPPVILAAMYHALTKGAQYKTAATTKQQRRLLITNTFFKSKTLFESILQIPIYTYDQQGTHKK